MNRFLNEVEPYQSTILRDEEWDRLDWNESVQGPADTVISALTRFITENKLHYYPDISADKLKDKLAQYTHTKKDYIEVFNGSDDALQILFMCFVNAQDKVLVCNPTYTQVNPFIKIMGGDIIQLSSRPCTFELELETLKQDIVKKEPTIVYLANPNNPTGIQFSLVEIKDLVESFPDILFIIDEAYYEFTGVTCTSLVSKLNNIVVTRTFSKAFGLAGIRLGYILACENILNKVNRIRNGKSVNILAQVAGIAALDNIKYVQEYTQKILITKQWFVQAVKKLHDFEIINTQGNYVVIKHNDPKRVVRILKDNNILVRDRSDIEGLQGCVRITIGLRPEMEKIYNILKGII